MKDTKSTVVIGFRTSKDNAIKLNNIVEKNKDKTTKSELLHLMLSFCLKSNIEFTESKIKIN